MIVSLWSNLQLHILICKKVQLNYYSRGYFRVLLEITVIYISTVKVAVILKLFYYSYIGGYLLHHNDI